MERHFIQVILPIRLDWEPFYAAPEAVRTGDRVTVPFAGREYVAVVSATGVTPTVSKVRNIQCAETGLDKVSPEEIAFWRQLAGYYLCSVGEIYRAACPLGATAAEEKAALWTAELERRLAAKQAALTSVRPGTKKEAALREGIISLQNKLQDAAIRPEAVVRALPHPDDPVLQQIRKALSERKTVLLEGQDDSLRAGVCLDLARRTLEEGKNVLYLVSSRAYLSQIEAVVQETVPEALLYDSGRTGAARRKTAAAIRSGRYMVVGTRTALLLPHHDLGLVIIDREHERSYKQDSPAPRYNGRDAALMLARAQGAAAIACSPTPSLDALYNVSIGRFTRILLDEAEPHHALTLIDTSAEKRKRGMAGAVSFKMLDAVSEVLSREQTVLVLVSRKAYDPDLQVAEELRARFPGQPDRLRVMHLGSALAPDLSGAGLICLLYAEALFSGDDFRSDERALQTLRQLRRSAPMVIQARTAEHPVLQALSRGEDATAFLMQERKDFGYPPFSRMIRITVSDTAPKRLEYMSGRLADALSRTLGAECVKGPYGKTGAEALRHIRILLQRGPALRSRKQALHQCIAALEKEAKYIGHIIIDVDPA